MATPTLDRDTKFLRFTWISTCAITRAKAVFVPSCKDLEKVANVGIPLCTAVEVCEFMYLLIIIATIIDGLLKIKLPPL